MRSQRLEICTSLSSNPQKSCRYCSFSTHRSTLSRLLAELRLSTTGDCFALLPFLPVPFLFLEEQFLKRKQAKKNTSPKQNTKQEAKRPAAANFTWVHTDKTRVCVFTSNLPAFAAWVMCFLLQVGRWVSR